jgi:hypothetical protein
MNNLDEQREIETLINGFIREACVVSEGESTVTSKDLYAAFGKWDADRGGCHHEVGSTTFRRLFKGYNGLALRPLADVAREYHFYDSNDRRIRECDLLKVSRSERNEHFLWHRYMYMLVRRDSKGRLCVQDITVADRRLLGLKGLCKRPYGWWAWEDAEVVQPGNPYYTPQQNRPRQEQ